MRRHIIITAAVITTILLALSSTASAQEQVGIRVGVSGDPDQFFFGGHLETAPLLERLVFRPNAEVGIGSDLTLLALNFDFAYKIPLDNNPWVVYFGAGPALNILSFNENRRRRGGETSAEGGFNILLGAEHPGGLFTEFKVGFSDSPDLKALVGYSF